MTTSSAPALIGLLLFAAACGSDNQAESPGGSGSCEPRSIDATGNLLVKASEANDYSFSSTLSIHVSPVASKTELSFDWAGVTKDFIGHGVKTPGDIDMVTLLMWNLDQAKLEEKLNDDALAQSDLLAIATLYTNKTKTSGGLFEFTAFGQPIDKTAILTYMDASQYDPAAHAYTVMAATGTVAGKGTRMMKGLKPDPASTNTQVTLDSQSTSLEYRADLQKLKTTRIPAAKANIVVDWTDLKTNSMGNPFEPTKIDTVLVGKYDESLSELEAKFLDLELVSEDMYRGSVTTGTSLALSSLTNTGGQAFSGIDDGHTWVVALICGSCANPAPWYLSTLSSCQAP